MAEEANVALSDPTTQAAETDPSQQDSGAKAADITLDEGTSEPHKEGGGQKEAADGTYSSKQFYSETRLTIAFFQPLRRTATQTTPLITNPPLPPQTRKISKCKTLQKPVTPRVLNLVQLYLPPTVHLLRRRE